MYESAEFLYLSRTMENPFSSLMIFPLASVFTRPRSSNLLWAMLRAVFSIAFSSPYILTYAFFISLNMFTALNFDMNSFGVIFSFVDCDSTKFLKEKARLFDSDCIPLEDILPLNWFVLARNASISACVLCAVSFASV